jgi:hypothetical protein
MKYRMQLKKRLSVARKTLAVSAFAAALLVSSTPVFAHGNNRSNFSEHGRFAFNMGGFFKGIGDDFKSEFGNGFKFGKHGFRGHGDRDEDSNDDATSTPPVSLSCRATADHVHHDALKAAKTERDTELNAANDVYTAALKAARDSYRNNLTASASTTGSTLEAQIALRIALRRTYSTAVKAAQQTYAAAKYHAANIYRDAQQTADETYYEARLHCRVTDSATSTHQ